MQQSTGESPFFLLYGQDPQFPTKAALCPPVLRGTICIDDYKSQMLQTLSDAWKLAQQNVKKAQQMQQDKKARDFMFSPGDRIFVHMPAIRSGPAYKLTRPYKGPYHVITTHPNEVKLQSVDYPKAKTIRVALNRVRHCPIAITDNKEVVMVKPVTNEDVSEDTENPKSEKEKEGEMEVTDSPQRYNGPQDKESKHQSVWESRLRPHSPGTAAS